MEEKETEIWRGQIRMPASLAEWLKARAAENCRSFNGQIVWLAKQAQEAGNEKVA